MAGERTTAALAYLGDGWALSPLGGDVICRDCVTIHMSRTQPEAWTTGLHGTTIGRGPDVGAALRDLRAKLDGERRRIEEVAPKVDAAIVVVATTLARHGEPRDALSIAALERIAGRGRVAQAMLDGIIGVSDGG